MNKNDFRDVIEDLKKIRLLLHDVVDISVLNMLDESIEKFEAYDEDNRINTINNLLIVVGKIIEHLPKYSEWIDKLFK